MGEALSIEGSTDAELFESYVEQFLAPTLKAGQVVVLDGLGAHRTNKVRELIEGRGAELVFLPSYSPDLNPIEEAISKIKNIVRKAAARTREALNEAISEALSAVTLGDVAGWFSHCGYQPHGINTHERRCHTSLREPEGELMRCLRAPIRCSNPLRLSSESVLSDGRRVLAHRASIIRRRE